MKSKEQAVNEILSKLYQESQNKAIYFESELILALEQINEKDAQIAELSKIDDAAD